LDFDRVGDVEIMLEVTSCYRINIREYRRDNQKWTIQRNWQYKVHKTKKNKQKHNAIFVGHYYAQTDTNNVNKTWSLLQTTGGNDEPHAFVCVRSGV
jgi:quinolinate synthase